MTASPAPSSIAERVLPRAKGARFQGLDGLRAIAALLILLHHVGFQSAATFTSPMGGYLARMDIGVPIFFTLSGFLLFRPIVVSVVDDTPLRPALDHLWRRAMRIYPAFWVSLLLIVVLTSEEFRDTGAAFTTLALVHIHWPDHVIGPMPQSWSLATEVTFYASLPLLARLIRPVLRDRAPAHRMTGLLFVVAGLYLASLFFRLLMFGLANDWTPAAVLWLPATIDYFAIGMGLAVLHAGAPSGSPLRERLERLAGPARWWWLAAAVVFVFVAQGLGLARGLAVATWPREMLRQLLYGVIGLCLLFPLVFGGDEGGVRRFVRRPTWHWLGTISYSIYLWHMVFIVHPWGPMDRAVDRIWNNTIRTDWFDRYQWTRLESLLDSRFVVVGVVAAVPTLVVAAASFYLVERAGLAVQGRVRRPVIDPTPSESLVARAVSRWRDASFRAQLAVIGGAALLVRLGYVVLAKRGETLDPGEVFPGDQFYYALAGDALADGKGFVVPWHDTSIALGLADAGSASPHAADHPPLTAIVAAPAGLLPGGAGSHVFEQRLTMVVLGAVSVVVIGLLGRAVAGRSVGLVAAALAAVHAGFWVNDGLVMAETLVTLATAGALWATVRYHRAASARLAVELGAWIGMATLARSEALLLVPLLVVPLVWVTHQEVRTRLMRAGVAAGVAGALLLPWVIPNMVRFEEPVLLSTNDGLTLAGANNPQTYSGDAIGFWTIEHAEATVDVSGLDQSEASRVLRDAAVDHATDNVSRWPTVVAARVGRVWSIYRPLQMLDWNKGEGREVWASMLALGGYLALLPAAAFGWWTLRRDGGYTWPFTALIVQVTMVGALFYGLSRFRVTAEIALVVLAAVALSRLMAWRAGTPPQRSRRRQ